MITQPLPDYDLEEVEAPIPRDVDPMLASQGFLDLIDEIRAQLKKELADGKLEVVQLTGAIFINARFSAPWCYASPPADEQIVRSNCDAPNR